MKGGCIGRCGLGCISIRAADNNRRGVGGLLSVAPLLHNLDFFMLVLAVPELLLVQSKKHLLH